MELSLQQVYRRCGKPRCRCNHGQLHGPYFHLCSRAPDGRRKQTLLRHELDIQHIPVLVANRQADNQQALQVRREARARAVELRGSLRKARDGANKAVDAALAWLGCYRRGRSIHERMDFPADLRVERRYALLSEDWRRVLSLDDYRSITMAVMTARKRANAFAVHFDEDEAWAQALAPVLSRAQQHSPGVDGSIPETAAIMDVPSAAASASQRA